MAKHRISGCCLAASVASAPAAQTRSSRTPRGETVERICPTISRTPWAHDPSLLLEGGRSVEVRQVAGEGTETVKLTNVVPPIRFDSGCRETFRDRHIESLRKALDGMRDRRNVRLHLVGHADDQRLSGRAGARVRRQRGPVARARRRGGRVPAARLALPAEAISYEWAGDTQPVASNDDAGRPGAQPPRRGGGLVRRGRADGARRGVLVNEDIKRIKVCRMETVCKMRYKEGTRAHARAEPRAAAALRGRGRRRSPRIHRAGPQGARQPAGQAERDRQVHRLHRRRRR